MISFKHVASSTLNPTKLGEVGQSWAGSRGPAAHPAEGANMFDMPKRVYLPRAS